LLNYLMIISVLFVVQVRMNLSCMINSVQQAYCLQHPEAGSRTSVLS
jgi:hypothetical protein